MFTSLNRCQIYSKWKKKIKQIHNNIPLKSNALRRRHQQVDWYTNPETYFYTTRLLQDSQDIHETFHTKFTRFTRNGGHDLDKSIRGVPAVFVSVLKFLVHFKTLNCKKNKAWIIHILSFKKVFWLTWDMEQKLFKYFCYCLNSEMFSLK